MTLFLTRRCGLPCWAVLIVCLTHSLAPGRASAEEIPAGIAVDAAWVRAAPPTVTVMAAYMTIRNTTSEKVTLRSITSPQFEKVEMHRSRITDGIMRMQRLDTIEIPPRSQITLAPGGIHLMLVRPRHVLRPGDRVSLVLDFDSGRSYPITAPVREASLEELHGKPPRHHSPGHRTDGSNQRSSESGSAH